MRQWEKETGEITSTRGNIFPCTKARGRTGLTENTGIASSVVMETCNAQAWRHHVLSLSNCKLKPWKFKICPCFTCIYIYIYIYIYICRNILWCIVTKGHVYQVICFCILYLIMYITYACIRKILSEYILYICYNILWCIVTKGHVYQVTSFWILWPYYVHYLRMYQENFIWIHFIYICHNIFWCIVKKKHVY